MREGPDAATGTPVCGSPGRRSPGRRPYSGRCAAGLVTTDPGRRSSGWAEGWVAADLRRRSSGGSERPRWRRRTLGLIVAAFAVASITLLSGCSALSSLVGTEDALQNAGYQSVHVSPHASHGGDYVTVSVRVQAAPTPQDASNVARVVWQKFRERFDHVNVTVHGTGPDIHQTFTHAELESMFGARNPSYDKTSISRADTELGVEVIGGVVLILVAIVAIAVLVHRRRSRRRQAALDATAGIGWYAGGTPWNPGTGDPRSQGWPPGPGAGVGPGPAVGGPGGGGPAGAPGDPGWPSWYTTGQPGRPGVPGEAGDPAAGVPPAGAAVPAQDPPVVGSAPPPPSGPLWAPPDHPPFPVVPRGGARPSTTAIDAGSEPASAANGPVPRLELDNPANGSAGDPQPDWGPPPDRDDAGPPSS